MNLGALVSWCLKPKRDISHLEKANKSSFQSYRSDKENQNSSPFNLHYFDICLLLIQCPSDKLGAKTICQNKLVGMTNV